MTGLLFALWLCVLPQQGGASTFGNTILAAPQNARLHAIVTRMKGLQNVPPSNMYGIFNADSTKFVAIVIKDSVRPPDSHGWYYNMRAIHGVVLNFKMYTAPQVFASQDTARLGALATVIDHIGRGYGVDSFWTSGMFTSANTEKGLDEDVAVALKKYPAWGAYPAWVVKQVAKEF